MRGSRGSASIPGDTLCVAKHKYTVNYSPVELGAAGPPPPDEEEISEILGRSLLDRAGCLRRGEPVHDRRSDGRRYDVLDDSEGQIPDRNEPV